MAFAAANKTASTRAAYASDQRWRPRLRRLVRSAGRHAAASQCRDCRRLPFQLGQRRPQGQHHRPLGSLDRLPPPKLAGHEPPTNQEGVKVVLRGIYRSIGTARAGKAAATAGPGAAPTLDFAGAFRRSELCALMVKDV